MMSAVQQAALRTLRTASIIPRTVPFVIQHRSKHDMNNPPTGNPPIVGRGPPEAPKEEAVALKDNSKPGSYLGTTKRLPEFNLNDNESRHCAIHVSKLI